MTDRPSFTVEQVRTVKERHEAELMRHPDVIGVGIGLVHRGTPPEGAGENRMEPGIVITVEATVPPGSLPTELEGVPVQVLTVGTLRALDA